MCTCKGVSAQPVLHVPFVLVCVVFSLLANHGLRLQLAGWYGGLCK
jgi:hypothetical protein